MELFLYESKKKPILNYHDQFNIVMYLLLNYDENLLQCIQENQIIPVD